MQYLEIRNVESWCSHLAAEAVIHWNTTEKGPSSPAWLAGRAGQHLDFSYSAALTKAAVQWDEKSLANWLLTRTR